MNQRRSALEASDSSGSSPIRCSNGPAWTKSTMMGFPVPSHERRFLSPAAIIAAASSSLSSPNKRSRLSSTPARPEAVSRRTDADSESGRGIPLRRTAKLGAAPRGKPCKARPLATLRRGNEQRNVRDAAQNRSPARRRVGCHFSSSAMSSFGATQRKRVPPGSRASSSRSNASQSGRVEVDPEPSRKTFRSQRSAA